MIELGKYTIQASLYEGTKSVIYRGIRQEDKQPVILKIPKKERPTSQERICYQQEYEIISNLKVDGVVTAYGLEEFQHKLIIVLEDFGGISLKQMINRTGKENSSEALSFSDFLPIAIQIADILGRIHSKNIIHKDINPSNIVIHPQTKEVKLIDFGISTFLSRETPSLKNPEVLEGTLAYLSPEQTGRMNRELDYRTDLYSLGVTFYELLTGRLPFESVDPLELVHCHIARKPPKLQLVNSAIPQMLSEIVLKLMAKTAEERYQSAWGLKKDLEYCWQQWQAEKKISAFTLGNRDFSDKFKIPQKLYGREREITAIMTAFERVVGSSESQSQSEIVLVAGYSGIGKSVLVKELYKPITASRGYFIAGKFEQFQRNIPYSAIIQAFKELIRQLLTETEAELAQWRAKLLKALGRNGQVIIDVISELELIIGSQPALPELAPTEALNRFNLVFQSFIQAFSSSAHPLVIFLDDLQWSDAATLKLIDLMMVEADTKHILLIGAYRDNEVDAAHPLSLALTNWEQEGATINQIVLNPLNTSHVNQLIADTLHQDLDSVKPLGQLVMQKTKGNPFFVNEFLRTLYRDALLKFDLDSCAWQWNINQIKQMNITNNVVELMIDRIQKLPSSSQEILCLAACVGAVFDLNSLVVICDRQPSEVFRELQVSVQADLIFPISDLDEQLLIHEYKFGHDRIQQAAYALIDDNRRQTIHLQIGRCLLQSWTTANLRDVTAENLFEVVDHLNLGASLITELEEKIRVARLNLLAGQKAKTSTAYVSALNYLRAGMELLSVEPWVNHYEETLALFMEAMEVEYLSTNYTSAKALGKTILQQAENLGDRIKVYELMVQIAIAQDEQVAAIDMGLQALELLGIPLITNEPQNQVALPSWEELAQMPEMTNPDHLAGLRLLIAITPPVHHVKPELFPQVALTIKNLCTDFGLSSLAAYAYGIYGLFLCAVVQDIEAAYHSGKLALQLIEKYDAKDLKCKVYMLFGIFICSCQEHARRTLVPLQEGIKSGLEVGDIEYVSYCIMAYCGQILLSGQPLEIVEQNQGQYIELLFKLKQEHCVSYTQIWRQLTLNFQGKSPNPQQLIGDTFDETKTLPYLQQTHNHQSLFATYVAKLILAYSFKEYPQAVEYAANATKHIEAAFGQLLVAVHNFYQSLALLALYPSIEPQEQAHILQQVNLNQDILLNWAQYAPMNFQHKYDLVEAEKSRILGNHWQATEQYEKAIQGAIDYGYLQEEALAYELAGEFYLMRGLDRIAKTYLQAAYDGYSRWQSPAKVEDLVNRYTSYLSLSSRERSSVAISPTQTIISTSNQSATVLDLATVIKASQAISGEIVIEKLLTNLMTILIQNAGAERGYLILKNQQKLLIEAEGSLNSSQVKVLQSIPLEDNSLLPLCLIQYVARTLENVVLSNATLEGNFTHDLYIQSTQPKSILCFPILTQGQLIGIVYLENNLVIGAFTPERLEVLNVLSAQAAISIENARLYQTLEDKVKERTAQLASANEEIIALNEKLKEENLRMGAELDVARQLQQMVLPKSEELEIIEGIDIAGYMDPADEVGGDYYDVLHADGVVTMGIGDVTGHGLESGILMLMTQTAVRTLQEIKEGDPVKFLDTLNRTIYQNVQRMDSDKNLTLAILNYSEGRVSISGQHEETIVVRAGGHIECIDTMDLGLPIGIDDDIADFIDQTTVELNSGDGVVLYTDGIPEAFDINKKQYGMERLCQVISQNWQHSAEEIKQAVIDDVREFIGKQKVFDDITLLVFKQQ